MSLLNSFLSDINSSLKNKDGQRIADLIHLAVDKLPPDRQQPYVQLNAELNAQYPKGNDTALTDRCREAVPADEFNTFTSPFSECLVRYFRYLRDFTSSDFFTRAVDTRQLTSQCVTALGDSRYGIVMIPIVLSFSRNLASLAAEIDRNPALARQSTSFSGTHSAFIDATANVLRDAFIKCLAGSPGTPRLSRPTTADKRIGIYLTANSTLSLLTRSGRLRNAAQIFTSIDAQSPPLSYYSAAQRVSYLYYLGRYHFANNHFLRAAIVLESAYRQCHPQFLKHRRIILTYLITANMTLGRLPSLQLITRPECSTFGSIFLTLASIIKSGDLGSFHRFLDLSPQTASLPHTRFLLRHRILLQLRHRCEILVWRSLIRRTFLISGFNPNPHDPDPEVAKKMPYLYMRHVRHAALFSFTRIPSHYYHTRMTYIHPEFRNIPAACAAAGYDLETGTYDENLIGQVDINDIPDPYPPLSQQDEEYHYPTLNVVEGTFMSLISQGFLGGFVAHGTEGRPRWAIPGAKARGGALPAGFPVVYSAIIDRAGEVGDVDVIPGWVKEEQVAASMGGGAGGGVGGGGSMAGRVVKLGNARPVGAQ